jgi:hypothetical protein
MPRQLHAFLERACQREEVIRVWSIMVYQNCDPGWREGDDRSCIKAASLLSYYTSLKAVVYLKENHEAHEVAQRRHM